MKIEAERFSDFSGGLNLLHSPHSLRPSESPEMQNLTWDRGALCCRRGQTALGQLAAGVVCCAPRLFHGWLVAHAGHALLAFKIQRASDTERAAGTRLAVAYAADLAETAGVFLPWRETLIYKTRGAFITIAWDAETDTLRGAFLRDTAAETGAYVPVIQLNTDPETGAGDLYQPENRLCGDRIVRFTAKRDVTDYHLPVGEIDLVRTVTVNGEPVIDYTVDLSAGIVRFSAAPAVTEPAVNNTVEIRYRKENPAAFRSVMDCAVGTLFALGQGLCLVLGGGEAQPNAWYWSGNSDTAMDPTYFPMSQYNLAGSMRDPITAFGTQQNRLVIFQAGSMGQAACSTAELSGRAQIAMDYARISDSVGCDLPGSLQSVENHLVWCSRRHGVIRLENRSAAGESSLRVLSRKLHGDRRGMGLLPALRGAETAQVRSVETGRKYLLLVGDAAWEWNHEISDAADPAWFFHRGIQGVGFVPEGEALYEVLPSGVTAVFRRNCMDFGGPIEKRYTLPPRTLGSDTRQKTVKSVVFTTRPEGSCNTEITYLCDFGQRRDPTNLKDAAWALWPRNLTRRSLHCPPYPRVFRRHPGFHNVRHFGVQLCNNEAGTDLSLAAVTILYTLRGKVR